MESVTVRIRRGAPRDASALAEFAARTFAETYAAENRPEDMDAHISASFGVVQQGAELTDPDVLTLLALDDEALAGYAQVRGGTPPSCVTHPAALEVRRFYVRRESQGRGVAQALMRAVKEAAAERGARHLWLSVWERNPRAIAFYRKVGFEAVGATSFFVGPDRQDDLVLVARLEDAVGRAHRNRRPV